MASVMGLPLACPEGQEEAVAATPPGRGPLEAQELLGKAMPEALGQLTSLPRVAAVVGQMP